MPPTPPGLTPASLREESGHATAASTRAAIDSGAHPAGGGRRVRVCGDTHTHVHTSATAPVTPSKWQPQDLAIVNRPGLISSLLTRSAGRGRILGWWATTSGTIHSSQTNHPPAPSSPTPMLNGTCPTPFSKYYGGAWLRRRGAGFIYSHSPDGYGNGRGRTPAGTIRCPVRGVPRCSMSFLFKDGSLLPEIPRCRSGVQGMLRGLCRGCSTHGTCLPLKKSPSSPKNAFLELRGCKTLG